MTNDRTSSRTRAQLREHDVVVVGARVAGAATAMLLARAGHDVLLVDRANLPRDTVSTHSLVRGGVVQLSRWGLLDEVLASGAPAIRSVSFHEHGAGAADPVRRTVRERAGVDLMLAPRRQVLDEILADAAVRAGATLLTGTTVTGVIRDDDGRVAGVTARDSQGTPLYVRARLVVGADGVRSRTARYVGAETLRSDLPARACFYAYVGGVPWDGFELHVADGAYAGVFPTHGDEANVWIFPGDEMVEEFLTAGSYRYDVWLKALHGSMPSLAHRVIDGVSDEVVRGVAGLPNHVRQAHGPGWALVGDAGYHRDAISGHGMTDAFRDAELLADAGDQLLRGLVGEERALAAYQAGRDAAIEEVYAITVAMSALPPRPQFLELSRQLAGALEREADALAGRPVRTGALALC